MLNTIIKKTFDNGISLYFSTAEFNNSTANLLFVSRVRNSHTKSGFLSMNSAVSTDSLLFKFYHDHLSKVDIEVCTLIFLR